MKPELFMARNVIVQGITGRNGQSHTENMLAYGTHIIAGTSPHKDGQSVLGVPVYSSIKAIQRDHTIDISVVFVPAPHAKSALIEAIDAEIPIIICITEGIPVHDMLYIKQYIAGKTSRIIGPNCPGVLVPGLHSLGIIPAHVSSKGSTGLVSRSGTLTYEAMDMLTRHNIGQRYVIGIGGDIIPGSRFTDVLELFEHDPEVERIVMIGEIGGTDEIFAADYIKQHVTKPVYAYVAGHSAPIGVQLGHAGAILGENIQESADFKTDYLKKVGIITENNLFDLIEQMK